MMWWRFPVIWFIAVIAVHIGTSIFDRQLALGILVLIVELAILCSWFVLAQGMNIRQLYRINNKLT